jgi:bifunctional non-homologous end joining protein LigD
MPFTPMLARLVKEPFDRKGWIFEIKWDGFRAIAEVNGAGGVTLYSRRHNSFNKRFPTITQELKESRRSAVLDGEIVALDEKGHSRFEWLVNRGPQRGTLVYYVFDLLFLDGKDLRQLPLLERKAKLKALLNRMQRVVYLDHVEEHGLHVFAYVLQLGLEGIVAKDRRSPYIPGPLLTHYWLKIKNPDFQRKQPVEFRMPRTSRR